MKKWEILKRLKIKDKRLKIDELIDLLLENRGIKTEKDREEFLHPDLVRVTPKSVGIDLKQLKKTIARITSAIEKEEQIVVFGDYDVDGITGAAILWETLYAMGAKVIPYIPHRVDEGYGLSVRGISNIQLQISNVKLIITVDNGIVAHDAVEFASEQGIDVIITDHHTVGEKLPKAYSIVHTTKLCGAGVALLLAKEIIKTLPNPPLSGRESVDSSPDKGRLGGVLDTHLELAALGTVADLVPLTGANRTIVKEGLKKLSETKRPGLLALFQQAGIKEEILAVYHIGFLIGPRLNAAGRMESAMDSLRLLCTKDKNRAKLLAEKLEHINRERQFLMRDSAEHATVGVRGKGIGDRKLLFVAHEDYKEGVIGLIAGRLVEAFYRPAIVVSIGEKHSKASVRSVSGFDIIAFLRQHSDHFVAVGGHPMAAGFTVETENILALQEALEATAETAIDAQLLIRNLRIDTELPLSFVTKELFEAIQQLAPFGMGNSEPVFVSRGVEVRDIRVLGKDSNHLKLKIASFLEKRVELECIGFGIGEMSAALKIGDTIDIAYTIDENTWNGNTKLQLKLKDVKKVV